MCLFSVANSLVDYNGYTATCNLRVEQGEDLDLNVVVGEGSANMGKIARKVARNLKNRDFK